MKTYNTYQEAVADYPHCKIITTGKKWRGTPSLIGKFRVMFDDEVDIDGLTPAIGEDCWVFCEEPKQVEWKNGDECRYNDINWLFCGFHPVNGLAIVANNDEPSSHQIITVDVELLSKPETPEQKEKRERLESAYVLYCSYHSANDLSCMSFDEFKSNKGIERRRGFLAILDKTNYRK